MTRRTFDLSPEVGVLRELGKALREKVRLPAAHVAEIAELVSGEALLLVDKAEPARVKADADDAQVLGEALAGQAEVFVTGDAALLKPGAVGALRMCRLGSSGKRCAPAGNSTDAEVSRRRGTYDFASPSTPAAQQGLNRRSPRAARSESMCISATRRSPHIAADSVERDHMLRD